MIHTTTYVHVHEEDTVTVTETDAGRVRIDLDGNAVMPVVSASVFLTVQGAQELALAILARFPLAGGRQAIPAAVRRLAAIEDTRS